MCIRQILGTVFIFCVLLLIIEQVCVIRALPTQRAISNYAQKNKTEVQPLAFMKKYDLHALRLTVQHGRMCQGQGDDLLPNGGVLVIRECLGFGHLET